MKRGALILMLGVVLACVGGTGAYLYRTAPERAMLCCKKPELAWLQHEFQMSDAQRARVQELDAPYQAGCADLCRRINATNALVRAEFTREAAVTPAMRQLLANAALLRAECQTHMLEYCQAVSREMPPAQGRRYLQWMGDQMLNLSAMMPTLPGHGN